MEFFELMATHHKKIHHSPASKAFARINLSAHPLLAKEDLSEFLKSIKASLNFPCLLANTYQGNADAADSFDAKRKIIRGEIFILDRVARDDWDARDLAWDDTEQIGTDIMSFLGEYYEENEHEGLFSWSEVSTEKLSNLTTDNLAGTKFYFTISIPNEINYQLNADAFDDELFES